MLTVCLSRFRTTRSVPHFRVSLQNATTFTDNLAPCFVTCVVTGHPGNVFITNRKLHIALLDFGQTKRLTEEKRLRFACLVNALARRDQKGVADSMTKLGIKIVPTANFTQNSYDKDTESSRVQSLSKPLSLEEKFGFTMFDTAAVPGVSDNPFADQSALRVGTLTDLPRDLFFLLRTIQILKGLCKATHNTDFSVVQSWSSIAGRESRKIRKTT